MKRFLSLCATLTLFPLLSGFAASPYAPETWFHIIDGNASKEGLSADIQAIAEAGIGGIQFFHGGWNAKPWPGTKEQIPCLSEKWEELVKFAETECHKRGLTFKMQNCPGWSMSGGPWITPDKAMRTLVAFEPGKKPTFEADQDYHEIGRVTFPCDEIIQELTAADLVVTTNETDRIFTFAAPVTAHAVCLPNPQVLLGWEWPYDPQTRVSVSCDGENVLTRDYPQGNWYDERHIKLTLAFDRPRTGRVWKISFASPHQINSQKKDIHLVSGKVLDHWEAKAGWSLRSFTMSTNTQSIHFAGTKTLIFGHINTCVVNAPAPKEGTGWECDKMAPCGFETNWKGYLGRLLAKGVKLDGTLVDSWECGCQTWTWKMEEEFEKRNGYALRPWMPALFGYILKSEAETEKFLLDWRNTCSRLVEENYYHTIAKIAHDNGMSVQYETAFGDVIPGDILRFWKYADEPMCELWSPHSKDECSIGSHNFKPVRPCVSAAHIYGKRRVSAESFTSFELTFNENFQTLKEDANRHFARGVTHLIFHTYTHNPIVGGKPPSTSFGAKIGTPFLRLQPWWKYMPEFTKYLEMCCRELERGLPVVDILWYLGDDVNHKPSEKTDLFENRYKYDYCNNDALMTRIDVKEERLVFPDGMNYRVLWVPTGTFILPATEKKLAELEAKGARVIRGELKPDWPSQLEKIGQSGQDILWYQRRDQGQDIFFVAQKNGDASFISPVALLPREEYSVGATERIYSGVISLQEFSEVQLDLGKVCNWATVRVNGQTAAKLWSKPYSCDITKFVKAGENTIEVEVTSTIYNQLVIDAKKPEAERQTWTLHGPKGGSSFADAGLYGPVVIKVK